MVSWSATVTVKLDTTYSSTTAGLTYSWHTHTHIQTLWTDRWIPLHAIFSVYFYLITDHTHWSTVLAHVGLLCFLLIFCIMFILCVCAVTIWGCIIFTEEWRSNVLIPLELHQMTRQKIVTYKKNQKGHCPPWSYIHCKINSGCVFLRNGPPLQSKSQTVHHRGFRLRSASLCFIPCGDPQGTEVTFLQSFSKAQYLHTSWYFLFLSITVAP